MKNIHKILVAFAFLAFANCSKDFLKKYDRRITGTWRITDTDKFGLGGNVDNLAFTGGTFTCYEDGSLVYVNPAGESFKGNWDIVKKITDEGTWHSLAITAVNYSNMNALSQYYDDIIFTGTNHFKAKIISGVHTYVTSFRR